MHSDRHHAGRLPVSSGIVNVRNVLIAALAAMSIAGQLCSQQPSFGPVMPANGFPSSYADGHGTNLALCLADPAMCLLLQSVAAPDPDLAFPVNYNGTFPSESFYWAATATMDTNNGGQALLVLALEASFTTGIVLPGDQTTFARMRLRVDNLVPGAIYTITTPYETFQTFATRSGRRGINVTADIGLAAGDFALALQGNVFPFLRWDSGIPLIDGHGHQFIGDPNVPHTVTGSPTGNNFFRIDGPSVGGPGVNSISTSLFSVAGMLFSPAPAAAFSASRTVGTAPLPVAFTSNATGAIGTWDWNFGDGGTARARNPSHVYTAPGVYTVSLTVTGPGGTDTHTAPGLIHVLPLHPRLSLTRNDGAGRRCRFAVADVMPNSKFVLCGSPTSGNAPFRAGRCAVTTGLGQPAVQVVKVSGGSGGTVEAELRVPLGLAGQTWFFQVLDPGNCSVSNVVSVTF